jgi:hypothetical protein
MLSKKRVLCEMQHPDSLYLTLVVKKLPPMTGAAR